MYDHLIQVALNKNLIDKLLEGLHSGAEGRALKVVIDTEGSYHVTSKGLTIVLRADSSGDVKSIDISNERYYSIVTSDELEKMRLQIPANDTYKALRERYSPYFHSLADNIVLFSRAYGEPMAEER